MRQELNPLQPPAVHLCTVDLGADKPGRLFVATSILTLDEISVEVLVRNLEAVYGILDGGKALAGGRRAGRFRRWLELLSAADSDTLGQSYWLDMVERIQTTDSKVQVDESRG